MITEEHQKEALNNAMIWAISGSAGVNPRLGAFQIDESGFDYGTDGTFSQVGSRGPRRFDSGFEIGFQLKATVNWEDNGSHILYKLCRKNYNDMVARNGDPRKKKLMLVLFCLPKDKDQWVTIDHDNVILKKSCYFTLLKGAIQPSEGGFEAVEIPKTNLLTPIALQNLLDDLENGVLV